MVRRCCRPVTPGSSILVIGRLSMRYEAMRDGLEDFELLTLLAKKDRAKAKEIADAIARTFTDYERDEKAFRTQRRELLEALD